MSIFSGADGIFEPVTDEKTRLATVKDVADTLDISERTVRRWCVRGELVAELLPSGSEWRITVRVRDGVPVRP